MAFPDAVLGEHERVAVHTRPHWWLCLRPAAALLLVAVPTGFASAVVRLQEWAPWAWALLGAVAVLVAARATVAPIARWRCTHLVLTDSRLIARDGVVATSTVEVPVDRIDAVRVHARRRERLLGAGTLTVDAAGERYLFTDVPRVERVQARLHREIGRSVERSRSARLERRHDAARVHADRALLDRTAGTGVRMAGWGTARAVSERTAS